MRRVENELEPGQDPAPWYREPYVWMLIAPPATAVIAGFITFGIANRTFDGFVVDDYYKRGLEINRVLDREHEAETLGLALEVTIEPGASEDRIAVVLAAGDGFVYPPELTARLTHATRKLDDRMLQLRATAEPGSYLAATDALPPGQWYVQVETESWRVSRRVATD